MPCPRTQHLNNVPRLRGEKHDISLKILHQAGFETARQAATSAERHALTIAPCPSLCESLPRIMRAHACPCLGLESSGLRPCLGRCGLGCESLPNTMRAWDNPCL